MTDDPEEYGFDEEQEFFFTPQGEEMYHTDVVETLNALLVVVRATQKEKADTVHTEGVDWVYGDKEQAVRDALAALPEGLK